METLPLITSGDLKSGRDEGVQIIPEELRTSSLEGSALSKTFEDYRHNLQTGSMALVNDGNSIQNTTHANNS